MSDALLEVVGRLERIESALAVLLDRHETREWYDTATVGVILDRSPYQVRQWCRESRVNAEKRACGRGRAREWMISHEELTRIKCFGLLPIPSKNGEDR